MTEPKKPRLQHGEPVDRDLDAVEGVRLWFVGYGKFLPPRDDHAEKSMQHQRGAIADFHTLGPGDPGRPKLMRFVSLHDLVDQAIAALRGGERIAELVVDDHGGPMMHLFANDWIYVTATGRSWARSWAGPAWRDHEQPADSNLALHASKLRRLASHLHPKGSVTLLGCNVTAAAAAANGAGIGRTYDLLMALSAELGAVEVRGSPHASVVGAYKAAPDQLGCRVRNRREQACRPVLPSSFHDILPWR